MATYATVDPNDTSIISTVDVNGLVLRDGETVTIPDFAGGTRAFMINNKAEPQWNLYTLVPDNTPCGPPVQYYIRTIDYSYTGVAGVSGTVTEQAICTQIPIADLYDLKRQDVADQDQSVRYNAVDTVLSVNWWLVVTRDLRFELDGIQGNWLQRQIDGQGWPGGVNAPWVGIYNAANNTSRRVQITGVSAADNWNTLYLEKTLHDQATGNASDASLNALDAAYDDGNGVWQNVADHNAADPLWGYPPTITLAL